MTHTPQTNFHAIDDPTAFDIDRAAECRREHVQMAAAALVPTVRRRVDAGLILRAHTEGRAAAAVFLENLRYRSLDGYELHDEIVRRIAIRGVEGAASVRGWLQVIQAFCVAAEVPK